MFTRDSLPRREAKLAIATLTALLLGLTLLLAMSAPPAHATHTSLAAWIREPDDAKTGVRHEPLDEGRWETQVWSDDQKARCSNNRLIKRPVSGKIRWVVVSTVNNPNNISFDVVIDRPGDDKTAWAREGNGTVVRSTPLPDDMSWSTANDRGFYIANVKGATAPFTVVAVAA
jgi:hypothetical protein